MIRLDVTRRVVDTKRMWNKVLAREQDCSVTVDKPCRVYENGELKVVYLEPDLDTKPLLQALRGIKYNRTGRSGGLMTNSRTVGFLPRVVMRRDFCTTCASARAHPAEHAVICNHAQVAASLFAEHDPVRHKQQLDMLARDVKPNWVLPGGVYTSGIANADNQLAYHYDGGNFKNSWSAMWHFSRDVRGGFLACPEYDVKFAMRSGSIIMFEGAKLFHGVTPLRKMSARAYRYTLVYYPMDLMRKCGTPQEELARIRTVRTERETRRAKKGTSNV